MHKIKGFLIKTYEFLVGSIAFYPSAITVFISCLGILTLQIEDNQITSYLKEYAPFLVINNADTARSILTTLIGGVISLTVFSFSMVMITLSQTSSNYSPRLLPNLIAEKKNQTVLGFYLGTIVFNILVLISILPSGDTYTLNILSILIGIGMGISCLGFFIYFIHNISTNIQIDVILKKAYLSTKAQLDQLIEKGNQEPILADKEFENWNSIPMEEAGYLQEINIKFLKEIVLENQTSIYIDAFEGQYVPSNKTLVRYDGVKKEALENQLTNTVLLNLQDNSVDNYIYGIKKITEVGIKAMSPGINDPATALTTLDYLSSLFQLRMQIKDQNTYSVDNRFTIKIRTFSFEQLLGNCYTLYRQYCKHDALMMKKLLMILNHLSEQETAEEHYHAVIKIQINALKEDVELNIKNKMDLDNIL